MKSQRRIFIAVLFQIQICVTAGLSLYPASELNLNRFTLVCDLQGATLADIILFKYNGNTAGACSSPPNPSCGSSLGSISNDNQNVNFTLYQNEIPTKGNALWTCSHGAASASYQATYKSYCQNKKVISEDKKTVLSCNCGFPDVKADIEYMGDGNSLGKEKINLTSSMASCSLDSRAMDFSSTIAEFPSGTLEVCAKIFTSLEVADPICGDTDCGFSWAGCISIFLIELAAFTTVIILLMLKKIGGFSKLKVVVSCAFLTVAVIIGLILGFVLTKCKENNLSIGLGIGLGCPLAVAHVVTIYVIHKKCDKDNKKGDDERKGTPTSTSNVEVTTRKASHVHLVTINGNKVDSQPKESHRPLPVPPATHPKHLEPLVSVPNDGATSSEKKKKKKKKKKNSEAREDKEDQ